VFAVLAAFLAAAPPAATPPPPPKILVLPPEPASGSAIVPWLAETVADILPRDLERLGVPVVDRAERMRAHEVLDIPVVRLTRATSIRLAEALGVSRIIIGTYERHEEDLTLSLRSLDVERGTLNPPQIATAPMVSLPALLHGLAWDIALAGPVKPAGTREDFLARMRDVPFAALEAYGQGISAGKATTRMDQLRRAIKLKPDYDEARVALARAAIETHDYATADAALTPVKDDSPLARDARFLQGMAWIELGRGKDAAALYAGLAEQDASPGVLSNQALALQRSGATGASALLRQAVAKAPGWADIAFNLGWTLLVEGDTEAAVHWLRAVTREAPRDVYARVALSWALGKSGHPEEAAEEWRGVSLMGPAYEGLAAPDLNRKLGRVVPSEQPLVIERSDVQLAAAHVGRAEALLKGNDAEGAMRELTRAAYLDPYSARAHEVMAHAYLSKGERDKALNELQMSLWCHDDNGVRMQLARALWDNGRASQAQAEARKILVTDPKHAEAKALLQKPLPTAPPPRPEPTK
jgi:Tfp pilus assembly protein PilF